jgi:hypothetical protein
VGERSQSERQSKWAHRSVLENGIGRDEDDEVDALIAGAVAFVAGLAVAGEGLDARLAAAAAAFARAASDRLIAFMLAVT